MHADTLILSVAAIAAGAIASVTGFGIGSILTPTLSLWLDGRLAVAIVSVPHLLGTALRFSGPVAWIAGVLSGLLGGLVGNQGGIRSAALLGFDLPRDVFVATAIALFVDGARMPVYLATSGSEIWSAREPMLIASVGVIVGTIGGARLIRIFLRARSEKSSR